MAAEWEAEAAKLGDGTSWSCPFLKRTGCGRLKEAAAAAAAEVGAKLVVVSAKKRKKSQEWPQNFRRFFVSASSSFSSAKSTRILY